ncbi:MAG: hypothetical protein KDA84_02370 [Planctomycetaceae bacterium]|nr:hypothetical protein [Planctomycetaceae bacterium]
MFSPKFRQNLIAGIVLGTFALIVATPLLRHPHGLLVGPQFDGRNDLTSIFLVFRTWPRQALETHGQLPLWNPFFLSGTPWFGNPQSGMLYPPNWIFFLGGGAWLASWMLIGHLWWGGLGVYFVVRRMDWNWGAGVLGGCAYLAAPFLIAQTGEGHYNQICVAAWIPWAFFVFEGFRKGSRYAVPSLALVMALMFFSGHVQECYYLAFLLTLSVVWAVCIPHEHPTSPGYRKRLLGSWFGAGAITVGLVAVESLPQFLNSKQSVRSEGLSLEQSGTISLGADNFRQLLDPFALGGPENYHGAGQFFWETFFHFGYTILALALLGLVLQRRNPEIWR